jgi:ethanolamine utilization protein EutN
MEIAKLVGNVWATRKSDLVNGYKLMQAEFTEGTRTGERIVVVDTIGAGIGDFVILTTGSSARRMLENDNLPIDAAVIGIIDDDCHLKNK